MSPTQPKSIVHIGDIVHAIVDWCDKPTLATLARTSVLFHEFALDALWRHLDSFWNLLKLFPNDLIRSENAEGSRSKPVVTRLIIPRDWARFRHYGRRVKSWGEEDMSYVDELFVDHLSFGRGVEYILPNLMHMEVRNSSISSIHLQTLLLCPSIESITIWNDKPDFALSTSLSTFLLVMSDISPKLKKLTVRWKSSHEAVYNGLADIFSHRPVQLSVVKLRSPFYFESKCFRELSQLPALTHLEIDLRQITDVYQLMHMESNGSQPPFPALRELSLCGKPDTFIKLLPCFGQTPWMTSLSLSVQYYPQSRELQELFETAAEIFPSLGTFQFDLTDGVNIEAENKRFRDGTELYRHDLCTIEPLLSLKQLVGINLEFGVPLRLTNLDVEVIALSWPSIRTLNLCTNPLCGRQSAPRNTMAYHRVPHDITHFFEQHTYVYAIPAPTLEALFSLTRFCSKLEHVGLFLNVYSDGSSYEAQTATMSVVSERLTMLNVGWSILPDPVAPSLAALLSSAFPSLCVIEWATGALSGSVPALAAPRGMGTHRGSIHNPNMNGCAHLWQEVKDLLRLLKRVRENERNKIMGALGNTTSEFSTNRLSTTPHAR